jgi:hypothetical protein
METVALFLLLVHLQYVKVLSLLVAKPWTSLLGSVFLSSFAITNIESSATLL